MSRRDPEGKIGLIVDEWGCWYDVEEGTNPGFLYQQNTMRDAIVAACNLNIFNNHSDKVVMANLAQAVNVFAGSYSHRGRENGKDAYLSRLLIFSKLIREASFATAMPTTVRQAERFR